jgi:hypothetical protein
MKSLKIQLIGLLVLMTNVLGVFMLDATNSYSSPKSWIEVVDSTDGMKASFPHKPIQMNFDIPFQKKASKDHLHIFTSSTKTGVFLLSTLKASFVSDQLLDEKNFKKTFETYFVSPLFYSPQYFQRNQTFSTSYSKFKGKKSLFFQFTYQDKHTVRVLKGFATVKEYTLYTLFYSSSQNQFKDTDFQYFINSFDLLD